MATTCHHGRHYTNEPLAACAMEMLKVILKFLKRQGDRLSRKKHKIQTIRLLRFLHLNHTFARSYSLVFRKECVDGRVKLICLRQLSARFPRVRNKFEKLFCKIEFITGNLL